MAMTPEADRIAKTAGMIHPDDLKLAASKGLCSAECLAMLSDVREQTRFAESVRLPSSR